ncbi:MAG: glutamine amidotransferase family protein [Planctomycetia bacterium]|nr:glutamine amidotransferase family protein [Planctomycetia bacterium]
MLKNSLREGSVRIPAGCAICGIIDRTGKRFSGDEIMKSIATMRERSNGLGGGFAAYGIYPQYQDFYALHVFYDSTEAKERTEAFLNTHFYIESSGRIPTVKVASVTSPPRIWRYFAKPDRNRLSESGLTEEEYVAQCVLRVNRQFDGAYIFSCGKNMGVFKGVGYPEEIGEFYQLHHYEAYLWTAHGRFPTNTPGWWGGAHPFALLDWTIVHNGEISSYDANRRYVEMFGYTCKLQTDTEVITYLYDLLVRKHGLDLETASKVLTAPLWEEIDRMTPEQQEKYKALRAVYAGALVTGPFSIILGFNGGMVALNDRLKLRALIAAEHGDRVYVASEESAIRVLCPTPDKVWAVEGGKPIIEWVRNDGLWPAIAKGSNHD